MTREEAADVLRDHIGTIIHDNLEEQVKQVELNEALELGIQALNACENIENMIGKWRGNHGGN